MDAKTAEQIAIQFLQQHHSVVGIKKKKLENGIWEIEATISSFDDKTKKVRIDEKTGKIVSVE